MSLSKKPYLHPSQKMTGGQLGPSSHKNEFHVGVLQGNWYEDRLAFGHHAQAPPKLESATVTRDSFPERTLDDYKAAKPPPSTSLEAPRHLLFGHGAPRKMMMTTSELSFPDVSKPGVTPPSAVEMFVKEGVSDRRDLLRKKQEEWAFEQKRESRYSTTKNRTFDATAVKVLSGEVVLQRVPSSEHGMFLKSVSSAANTIGLRGDAPLPPL